MELYALTLYGMSEASFPAFERYFRRAAGTRGAGAGPVRWIVDSERRLVRCAAEGRKPGAARLDWIARRLADAAAEFIMGELEPETVKRLVDLDYGGERQEDRDGITAYSLKSLAGTAGPEARSARLGRKRRMADELAACLREHRTVSLDGFVRFRLQEHKLELGGIVEDAAQEYMMDRQYREFITLLRHVVNVKEARLPVVHLIHRGQGAAMETLDARFRPVRLAADTPLNSPELKSEGEDMIVSALIEAMPRRVVIHSRQPAAPVVRTIEGIFSERVRICRRCASCAPYFTISGTPDS